MFLELSSNVQLICATQILHFPQFVYLVLDEKRRVESFAWGLGKELGPQGQPVACEESNPA